MNNGIDPLHSKIFSPVNFGMAEMSRSAIEMSDKFVFVKKKHESTYLWCQCICLTI